MNAIATPILRELYDAAIAFQSLAPWRWMDNADLFAVSLHGAGQTYYCTVMGALHNDFGLAVFPGEEGCAGLLRLLNDELDPESLDPLMHMSSLSLTFVDRADLHHRDYRAIRSLDLKFRGKNAWPVFRSQHRGYWPWHLDEAEAATLAQVLRHAATVATFVRDGALDLRSVVESGDVVTMTLRDGRWATTLQPLPEMPEPELPRAFDRSHLRDIAAAIGYSEATWEVDLFVVPARIQESRNSRPFAPRCILVTDEVGLIVDAHLLGPLPSIDECQDTFVAMLERAPALPSEIRVPRPDAARMLLPVTKFLDIPLSITETPQLDFARQNLLQEAL